MIATVTLSVLFWATKIYMQFLNFQLCLVISKENAVLFVQLAVMSCLKGMLIHLNHHRQWSQSDYPSLRCFWSARSYNPQNIKGTITVKIINIKSRKWGTTFYKCDILHVQKNKIYPKNITPVVKHGGGSIMLSSFFSSAETRALCKIIKGFKYQNNLPQNLQVYVR